MIEDAFDPIEERRRYEEETEREAARVREQDEQSRYLFGTQFDRYFPMYVASHGAVHTLDLIGMKDIVAYVRMRSAEMVEKIESEARRTINELNSEARRLREKNIYDATERSINVYLAGDYKKALDRLHNEACNPDRHLTAEQWKSLVEKLYTRMETEREKTRKVVELEHARLEAEEREFYLENFLPSRWI